MPERPSESDTIERQYSDSERNHAVAKQLFPGGVSHNVRFTEPHPIYMDAADGAEIVDVDGNTYVDFWNNHHASILGHTHPDVVEAVKTQAEDGLHYGMPNERCLELGRLIPEFVPSAERIRFCGSGTEATMYAVRLARAFTGRKQVLKVEGQWHGGNTDLAIGVHPPFDSPTTRGLPPNVEASVSTFRLNDIDSVSALLDAHRGDVAAVILDPRKAGIEPDSEFLQFLAEMRDEREFCLIFDEVVTGFRVSPGSYQARCGVTPDLTTLGKCLGGGLPVGALVGRADLFENARPDIDVPADDRVIAGGGTFSENPMTLVAGVKTLEFIQEHGVYGHTEGLGERLRDGLETVFEELDVTGRTLGFSSLFLPAFGIDAEVTSQTDVYEKADLDVLERYHWGLIDRGYFFLPGAMGNITYQHTEDHIDGLLRASRDVLEGLLQDGVL